MALALALIALALTLYSLSWLLRLSVNVAKDVTDLERRVERLEHSLTPRSP